VNWRKGYLYQYTGSDWIELDPKQHSDKYMIALNDLLEGAPDAIFNNIFCGNLLTNQAFIKYLQVLSITLSQLVENGVTRQGEIKSGNYEEGVSGFRIKHDGDAEFNNGKFRGTIYANDGTFHGRIEADEGFFKGLLETPALRSSTETVYSSARSYAAGTTVQNAVNSEKAFWGNISGSEWNKLFEASGTFRGQPISQLGFLDAGSARPMAHYASITVIYSDGSNETLWDQTILPAGGLSFQRITAGWNIQMRNLPTSDPRIPNVIWRDGTTLKISVG
jgi:hypothetical protein